MGRDPLVGGVLDKDFNDHSIINDVGAALAERAVEDHFDTDTLGYSGSIVEDSDLNALFDE